MLINWVNYKWANDISRREKRNVCPVPKTLPKSRNQARKPPHPPFTIKLTAGRLERERERLRSFPSSSSRHRNPLLLLLLLFVREKRSMEEKRKRQSHCFSIELSFPPHLFSFWILLMAKKLSTVSRKWNPLSPSSFSSSTASSPPPVCSLLLLLLISIEGSAASYLLLIHPFPLSLYNHCIFCHPWTWILMESMKEKLERTDSLCFGTRVNDSMRLVGWFFTFEHAWRVFLRLLLERSESPSQL